MNPFHALITIKPNIDNIGPLELLRRHFHDKMGQNFEKINDLECIKWLDQWRFYESFM